MGLTADDIGNMLKLLQRVQGIHGAEVMTIAVLIGKLTAEHQRLRVPHTPELPPAVKDGDIAPMENTDGTTHQRNQ